MMTVEHLRTYFARFYGLREIEGSGTAADYELLFDLNDGEDELAILCWRTDTPSIRNLLGDELADYLLEPRSTREEADIDDQFDRHYEVTLEACGRGGSSIASIVSTGQVNPSCARRQVSL